jgi:hypothetical protein
MLFQFAERTIAGIVFAAICVSLITYFGQAELFDPIILVTFIAIGLAFRRNRDLVFVCMIFVVERGMEEMMWRTLQNELWFKLPAYLLFIYISYAFCRGSLRWIALLFFSASLAIEVYWYYTADWIPFTLLTCYMVAAALLVRYALRRRVFWQINMFSKRGSPMPLDRMLLNANAGFIALYLLMAIEIYLSELTNIPIFYVYDAFTPVAQGLSLFIIYMVIIESVRHLKAVELHA